MTLRRPSLATVCAALCAATLLAACSQQSANPAPEAETATATVHPESGLEVIPVTVTSSNGEHVFAAEVAATDREQAMGLMFRTAMGADEGMIFPYDPPEPLSFWMRNTVLPLDIVFIGPDPQRGRGNPLQRGERAFVRPRHRRARTQRRALGRAGNRTGRSGGVVMMSASTLGAAARIS